MIPEGWRPLAGNECAQIGDEFIDESMTAMMRRVEERCATCGTTEGLHEWQSIDGRGWTCLPCVRQAQASDAPITTADQPPTCSPSAASGSDE